MNIAAAQMARAPTGATVGALRKNNFEPKSSANAASREALRARVEAWYAKQIESIAKAHGPRWPEHKDWIDSYLQAEIRQRLMDMGWRNKE